MPERAEPAARRARLTAIHGRIIGPEVLFQMRRLDVGKIVVLLAVTLVVVCAVPNPIRRGKLVPTSTTAWAAGPALSLALNTSLDNIPGTVKATSITKAELLKGTKVVSTATIAGGVASFDLSTLTATGDYFIRVNGDANDLVPTRIKSLTASLNQFVGRKLRRTYIGSLTAPAYKADTFSKGQAQHGVVGYSNGAAVGPAAQCYAIVSKSPAKVEMRVLGSGALLTSYTGGGEHSFQTWVIGPTNHGTSASSGCTGCHSKMSTKPATYASCGVSNGWCYKCHYGAAGSSAGFVNPTK